MQQLHSNDVHGMNKQWMWFDEIYYYVGMITEDMRENNFKCEQIPNRNVAQECKRRNT